MNLAAISGLSARLGADLTLVQGGGGNASIKQDGVLWVKASGKWLAHARRETIFVPVALDAVRDAIRRGDADPVSQHVCDVGSLRPSIETTLHALLPHAVVVHLHAINALAVAIQAHGRDIAADRLRGLRWTWIPYSRPGIDLTHAVAAAGDQHDILILENHGLVVGADDCDAAWDRVAEVESRLAIATRASPVADLATLRRAAGERGMALPVDPIVHDLATDPVSLAWFRGGVLFPDQVVFLGPVVAVDVPQDTIPYVILPGVGVLVRPTITDGQHAMLQAIALLLQRIPSTASVVPLSSDEVAALAGWEAEKYRIALDAQQRR